MRIADLAKGLRDTSERFGGIRHYLEAAGLLDKASSEFMREQTLESLTLLNGAIARAERLRKETAEKGRGPVAV